MVERGNEQVGLFFVFVFFRPFAGEIKLELGKTEKEKMAFAFFKA